jgi:hypothetical protein
MSLRWWRPRRAWRVLVVWPGPKRRPPEDRYARFLTQLGSAAGSCLHERLASDNQEIRDGSEEEAEAGGRDREAGQGQEEEDLARQVI